jgi:ATP-dependent exoDNAse (exonuclease V) beta subunit
MSDPALTPEQAIAVSRREGDLLVAAGAGAGKTTVLVERFTAAVCEDAVPIESMLAITFTDKAAAELRGRVRARLAQRGEQQLARAAETAFISTIHGFCARLLRTHALAAGLDPGFRVLDEIGSRRLALDAFDRALAGFLHDEADTERLRLAAAHTPDRLGRMVMAAYGHLRSRGQRRPELPRSQPPARGDELEALRARARAALDSLEGVIAGVTVEAARGRLHDCLDLLAGLPEAELPEPRALAAVRVGRGATALKADQFDAYRDALSDLTDLTASEDAHRDQVLVRELVRDYGARYEQLKNDRSALDYDDLELLARDLLRDDPAVRERWTGRFAHVLVDEFQDTNELQNELLELLEGATTFRVGDEFQSIYRFRHADVEVFRRHAERAGEAQALAAMTVNFRSATEVLDAINLLFGSLWGERFPLLVAGPEAAAQEPAQQPRVELIVADHQHGGKRWQAALGGDDGEQPPFGPSMDGVVAGRAAEARALAARVDELTRDGPYRLGDVVVLVRATTHLAAYEQALEDRRIATYVAGGRGYFSQQQVADLRAYLGALANPLDGLALYTALASPLAGVSLDGLVLIAAATRERRCEPWDLLEQLADRRDEAAALAQALPARDAERAVAFVGLLRGERHAAPRVSLEVLIDRGVSLTGYDRHLLALPGGERRMANVRKLMRLAREFEAEEGRDVRAFIDFIGEREELGERQGEAPLEPESLNAVRLMTVHRAKGLEFPVVCVADLGKPGREDVSPLRISEDGSVGISIAQLGGGTVNSPQLEAIKRAQREADEQEERRVFYVAATRAEQHLILSGTTDLEKLSEPRDLAEPMRWVWRGLATDLARLGSREVVEHRVGQRTVQIGVTLLRPETVEEVLPPSERSPGSAEPPPPGLEALDAPVFDAPEVPAATPVSRVSYSSLESYRRCGYRFYLERGLGLPGSEPAPGDARDVEGADGPEDATAPDDPHEQRLPGRVRGSAVHDLLERIDFAAPAVPGAPEIEASVLAHGEQPEPRDVEEIAAMIAGFLESGLSARIADASSVHAELAFGYTLTARGRGLLVTGIVDVRAVEADRVLIVDYKTDRLEGREPGALVEEAYATQRMIYALAALRGGAQRVEVAYSLLERPHEPIAGVYEHADADALEARLTELAAGVIEGRFEPSEQPHIGLCGGCPGRASLCHWEPERTGAPAPRGGAWARG